MGSRVLNLATALSLALAAAVAALWFLSYWRPPVEWAHLPSPAQNWLFEMNGVDGEFYVGWWNHGIVVPCFLPFIILIVWPCTAGLLRWKRRQRRRGYSLDV